jgi:hypothetical protein
VTLVVEELEFTGVPQRLKNLTKLSAAMPVKGIEIRKMRLALIDIV